MPQCKPLCIDPVTGEDVEVGGNDTIDPSVLYERAFAEDLTLVSTSGTTLLDAVVLNFTPNEAGNYEIIAHFNWYTQKANNRNGRFVLDVDGAIIDEALDQTPKDVFRRAYSMHRIIPLTAAPHVIKLQYAISGTGPANTVFMEDKTIRIQRWD